MGLRGSGVPDFSLETELHGLRVAGVDEVGRGPLAGPVMAAAVVLDPSNIPEGLDDSKKLSPKRRAAVYAEIVSCADVAIGQASVEEIDGLNILRASHLAMLRAIRGLAEPPDHVLIDGHLVPAGLNLPANGIVKGDARSQSIAAASIVAKVRRDALMVDLAQQHPGYGWETNKGYPSKSHKSALQNLGVTPHHRRSFRPVHNILYQEEMLSD
ncbi:MAG: ribonuclease HII [Pseudomonadota bacterium]